MDALAELPLGERVGIEVDSLRDASDRLGDLIGRVELLTALLALASSDRLADESSRLSAALDKVAAAAEAGADRIDLPLQQLHSAHAALSALFA